jgi:hypothetical protein
MGSLTTLAQALGVAYASGINLYATVTILGLSTRMGWIGPLPGGLDALASWPVIALAGTLFVFEFLATLVPGISAAWETLHSLVRPPAGAALAVVTAWHGDPAVVLAAALLGGGLALTTHTTKLGLRYAVDASPEPVTNGAMNTAELGLVATISYFIWQHPWISLAFALAVLVAMMLAVRLIWRTLRRVLSGRWMPARGLLHGPRCSFLERPVYDVDED